MEFLKKLFRWILAALGLIGLIEELNWIKIHGRLEKWIDAYSSFVNTLSDFLFGWIDL